MASHSFHESDSKTQLHKVGFHFQPVDFARLACLRPGMACAGTVQRVNQLAGPRPEYSGQTGFERKVMLVPR